MGWSPNRVARYLVSGLWSNILRVGDLSTVWGVPFKKERVSKWESIAKSIFGGMIGWECFLCAQCFLGYSRLHPIKSWFSRIIMWVKGIRCLGGCPFLGVASF